MDDLVIGDYYVIDIDPQSSLVVTYPKIVQKYALNNVVVRYVDTRIHYNNVSFYTFEHTIPDAHIDFYTIWTTFSASTSDSNNWSSSIYRHKFTIKKNLKPILLKCISKFKKLLYNKKRIIALYLLQLGLNKDINHIIINKIYST